ncbi:MAG: hypothetical protein Q4G43_17400 [Mobilicoccus sp.]|nr:hypothetical protein [Mobilicoccus sp.]
MRTITALLAASAMALTATPAFAAPSTNTRPPAPVVTRADIDGDGRPDTIRVARRSVTDEQYVFRITVETAAGKRAIRDALVANYDDGSLAPADVWGGTAHLDGVRGAEMLMDLGGGVGDAPWPHLYTWRNGRIIPAPAPGATAANPAWDTMAHWGRMSGYTVSTVKGQRRITVHALTGRFDRTGETVTYRGTHTTYRWHRGTWQKISTTRSGTLNENKAYDYAGWNGITWRG